MLTTDPAHDCSLVETGKKNKKCEEIKKPQCILDYNTAKKNDVSDQMSAYHLVLRKSTKLYKKVLFEFIYGTAIINSCIIYNQQAITEYSITEFRKLLAKSLIQE